MIFVRTGPRFLFLRTEAEAKLREKLVEVLQGKIMSFTEAMEIAGEANTIVLVTLPDSRQVSAADREVVLLPVGSSVTLSRLFNTEVGKIISRAELGPGMLVQRVPRDGQKVIETVQDYYGAEKLELGNAVSQGEADDTVIVFTDRPVSRPIRVDEVLSVLLVKRQVPEMYRELRQEAVRYFTVGLESGQWHEVRINIYDVDEQYEIHYRRLVQALEDLEAGLILGETWTRDHALALFSVVAYQVRLFTTLEPLELKQVLLGLEYNAQGFRFVDLDLYYRRRKVERGDIIKNLPKDVRGYGMYFREQLFSRLSKECGEKISQLEEGLTQSSTDR
ncbi:MAG: hypothetical protein FH756_16445 [Firmicutes bacterium]|nr:hypothetical protein [Bacillota bacterium]